MISSSHGLLQRETVSPLVESVLGQETQTQKQQQEKKTTNSHGFVSLDIRGRSLKIEPPKMDCTVAYTINVHRWR